MTKDRIQIIVDDGDDETEDAVDRADSFGEVGDALSWSVGSVAELPLGRNRLRLVYENGRLIGEAHFLTYTERAAGPPDTVGDVLVDNGDDYGLLEFSSSAILPSDADVLMVRFADGVPPSDMQSYLRESGLRPTGIVQPLRVVFARPDTANIVEMKQVIESLNGEADPRVIGVFPNLVFLDNDIRWEAMPKKLADSYLDTEGTFVAGGELTATSHWHVFATQTFPAIRFLETLPGRDVAAHTLAVLEAAYGSSGDAPLPVFTDTERPFFIPGSRLVQPYGRKTWDPEDPKNVTSQVKKYADGELGQIAAHNASWRYLTPQGSRDDHCDGTHGRTVISHAFSDGVGPGSGFVVGPGFDLRIRPIGMGGWTAADMVAGFELLADVVEFPQLRVANFSESVWYKENNQLGLSVDTLDQELDPFNAAVTKLLERSCVLVCSAGNQSQPIVDAAQNWYAVPAHRGPSGPRSNESVSRKLVVVVGGSAPPMDARLRHDPSQSESLFDFVYGGNEVGSNTGEQVSLIGPAMWVPYVSGNSGSIGHSVGTSFSAPFVSAVITQLFTIDPSFSANPVKAIELVEATADQLPGLTPEQQGHGRVNVWKAVLSAANGHLSAQAGRTQSPHPHFTSCEVHAHQPDSWYGFEILTREHGGTVWLFDGTNHAPLTDDGAPALSTDGPDAPPPTHVPSISGANRSGVGHVTTCQAVRRAGSRIPYGELTLLAFGIAPRYLACATLHTSQMQTAGGWKRLRVYPKGTAPDAAGTGAVIDVLLDPAEMRLLGGSTRADVRTFVTGFDDFVFTVEEAPEVAFAGAGSSKAESAGSFTIDVVMSRPSPSTVTVGYAAVGGTATGGGVDYSLMPGTLTFAPGSVACAVTVSMVDDAAVEPDETVVIELQNAVNSKIGAVRSHTVTVIDDD
jgi:hypothetical protein